MSEIVKCDECGGRYSQRYLASHKRLSHRKKDSITATAPEEPEAVNVILAAYKRLSVRARKVVLERLSSGVETN